MIYSRTFILLTIAFSVISCGGQTSKKNVSDSLQEPIDVKEIATKEIDDENSINLQREKDNTNPAEECEGIALLKKFYSIYLSGTSMNHSETLQLHAEYMTEAMQNKILRMTANTDINAVLRAQDVPEDSCATLEVKDLGNDWYMVGYTFGKGGEYEKQYNIPVKVVKENGRCLIAYITPLYEGQIYGDSLWCHTDTFPAVDRTEPLAFVKNFYELYTAKYGCLIPNLQQELASIRRENLTPKALEQFAKAEESNRLDGYNEYDLLIKGFDFEYLWRPSLKITPADKANTYRMSYEIPQYSKTNEVTVEVIEKDGKYYIDDIQNEDSKYFL